jgi:hypothetical protein
MGSGSNFMRSEYLTGNNTSTHCAKNNNFFMHSFMVLCRPGEHQKVTTPKCNSDLSQTTIKATVKANK